MGFESSSDSFFSCYQAMSPFQFPETDKFLAYSRSHLIVFEFSQQFLEGSDHYNLITWKHRAMWRILRGQAVGPPLKKKKDEEKSMSSTIRLFRNDRLRK